MCVNFVVAPFMYEYLVKILALCLMHQWEWITYTVDIPVCLLVCSTLVYRKSLTM